MDNTAIKSFAIESRRQMIESVKYQASLIGITSDYISEPISKAEGMETYDYGAGTYSIYDNDIRKRESLVREIQNKGFENVIEEVAYTWFNRIIAIRFMEVNDYLPTRTRVLSSETEGKKEPDIITEALDLDLDYTSEDKQLIFRFNNENKLDELFQFLFIKQCNKLNEILPGLFKKNDDYFELLLNISFTDEKSVVNNLINNISENNFKDQVEIIGWLYQFYNAELKDETFANLKKRIKISKERIPAATQLFTPDWIVKYMVENSVGRLWLEGHPNDELKSKWKYFVDEAKQESEVEKQLLTIKKDAEIHSPKDIKVIDPCMGSGHILVYIFDVLMQIYVSEGYTENDASIEILENNLYGLDIDDRAYQLSYFAVMMKARSYNRRIFRNDISLNIVSIQESNNLSEDLIDFVCKDNPNIRNDINNIIDTFFNGKIYGSIINVPNFDYGSIKNELNKLSKDLSNLFYLKYSSELNVLNIIIEQAKILNDKYDVVVTNPPYLGKTGLNNELRAFLKSNYPNSKTDLFAVFIEKCENMLKLNGFSSMITQQTFMFLSTYERLRKNFLKNTLINMVHLGSKAFAEIGGEVVQSTAFVYKKSNVNDYISVFIRLVNFDSQNKLIEFFNKENWVYNSLNKIKFIPGSPIAYWIDEGIINAFQNSKKMEDCAEVKSGLSTGDNDRFLRYWFEINYELIDLNSLNSHNIKNNTFKWYPYNKGGLFRKWYGNQDYVVNWENNGFEIKNFEKSVIRNDSFYFKKSLTWSRISSSNFGIRFSPEGFIFDVNSPSLFIDSNDYYYMGGLLCSNISTLFLSILNPTLTFQVGNINMLPIIYSYEDYDIIEKIVKENIEISRNDWFDYETSWGFSKHPLLKSNKYIKENFSLWENYKNHQFNLLKTNEIELNKIFSKIYNINIDCNVEDNNITISKANYESDIKSFISYAVGCMFGRYSLDNEGIQFAGGTFDLSNYSKFIPDDDNIIPVLDTEYFEDDIVGRFVEFVKVCFGEETLEENLNFIAGALKKKGKTNREIIRNYFLNDFFKDHLQMYKKCPIYWQFDSGKQNGFKSLIYMHRYDSTIIARVRTDYLHKTQKAIEQNLSHCDNIISNSSNKSEISKATKDKSKYIKQLDEIKVYDEALRHMATQKIEIDLDDGVKVNYAKFQKVEISIEGEKPKKINLLKNI